MWIIDSIHLLSYFWFLLSFYFLTGLLSNRQMFIMLPIPMVKNMQLKYTKHLFWDLSKYTMTSMRLFQLLS